MISSTLQGAINTQIKHELYSAYLYLSMAAFAEAQSLPGFANWLRKQSVEEVEHALKFYDYLVDRGGRVTLQAIDAPPTEFASPLAVFEETYAHEQKVTALINDLYATALAENDYATQTELQWFITEQVEEEKSASAIVEMLKMAGDRGQALLMVDRYLASRSTDSDAVCGEPSGRGLPGVHAGARLVSTVLPGAVSARSRRGCATASRSPVDQGENAIPEPVSVAGNQARAI